MPNPPQDYIYAGFLDEGDETEEPIDPLLGLPEHRPGKQAEPFKVAIDLPSLEAHSEGPSSMDKASPEKSNKR